MMSSSTSSSDDISNCDVLPSEYEPSTSYSTSSSSKQKIYEKTTESRYFGGFPEQITVSKEVKKEKRKYRCRKRSPATIERAKTVRRDKANARERRRMNSLNDALEHLRTILPALPDEPKMTKIETLKKAQDYIAAMSFHLSNNCDGITCGCCSTSSSVQSTPFQSPCFPPPTSSYSTPMSHQQINNNNQYNHHHQQFFSPHYPQ